MANTLRLPLKVVEKEMAALGIVRKQSKDALRDIKGERMVPWMERLAEHEAGMIGSPQGEELRVKAEHLSGQMMTPSALRLLRFRPDYREYREKLKSDAVMRARMKMVGRTGYYVDSHFRAQKLANKAKDYEVMAKIAGTVLERVWPKQETAAVHKTVVNVNLGGRLKEEILEGEVEVLEVVEVKQLGDGAA